MAVSAADRVPGAEGRPSSGAGGLSCGRRRRAASRSVTVTRRQPNVPVSLRASSLEHSRIGVGGVSERQQTGRAAGRIRIVGRRGPSSPSGSAGAHRCCLIDIRGRGGWPRRRTRGLHNS